MEKVKINFHSTIDGEEYGSEYTGEYENVDGKIKVGYYDGTMREKTEIVIVDDFISVKRTGKNTNLLEYKKGYLYKGEYNSEYGSLPLEIFTKKLSIISKPNSLGIFAKYTSSLSVGEATFSIIINFLQR